MKLGVSKTDITPTFPVKLAGFAHRKDKTKQVYKKLYVKTFTLRNDGQDMLLIISDLIWWDNNVVKKLRKEIEKKYLIPQDHICFHATHSHSGPQISDRFSDQLGEPSANYIAYLESQVLTSVQKSMGSMENVFLKIGKGVSDIGIYRRKKINGQIQMLPNESIPVQDDLTVIQFMTDKGNDKAMLIHYTCHPSTTDANVISSEFPGVCCEEIEKVVPDSTVAFLQGFCGDVRPSLVKEGKFYRGTLQDMERIGFQLAKDVLDVCKKIEVVDTKNSFVCKQVDVPLVFAKEKIKHMVPVNLQEEWPRLVDKAEDYILSFQYLKLNEKLAFLGCNAEMVQAYGKYIEQVDENVLPLGYSNGMIGYIPTKKQLKNGGYESEESIFYFGYPKKIAFSQEEVIKGKINELIGAKGNE